MKRLKNMRPAVSLATLITALIPLSSTNAGFVGSINEYYYGTGYFAQASYWNWTGQTFANGWTMARYSNGYDVQLVDRLMWGLDGGNGYYLHDQVEDYYVLAENYWSGNYHVAHSCVVSLEWCCVDHKAEADVD